MTPVEKAQDLLHNYEVQVRFSMEDCLFTYRDSDYGLAIKRTAKQCALIAIDEILSMGVHLNFDYEWVEHRPTDIKNWFDTNNSQVIKVNAFLYWVNVRKEIKKL
jgi:hypothetical protein